MSSVTTSGTTRSAFSFSRIWDQFGMLVVFAVLFIGCVIFVPNFASFINMKGLGLAISMSGMVACGMLFCLASGGFRSVGRLGYRLCRCDHGGGD
ncbi:L-arabinose transporter permease protein [Klebsiella michiganensis]|uniref:L-arabinose transporter permease protein n=1 Tax=Klebsiella michiganensis TaxID=1134687 RepID=A0A7H4PK12_9ENTR|nr:L-arabinose transporter permease protein [Klebsiella michiganensis]